MKQPVGHLILMGVAGCGKTTAATNLHNALGRPVAEADDFHPEANIAKMSRGAPLTDADRRPWLESLRAWMSEQADRGTRTIVTCSALKRSYRDLLVGAHGRVFFIHLVADEEALRERMEHREGHFMPSALLPSQFADLEPLADDEDGVTVTSRPTPEQTLEAILAALETADAAGNATTSTAGNATTSTITSTAASASAGL
ncbi:gluconokinase [Actinomyces sp. oral taxon 414]|uniref:gluconokinase n=1 Tax=Actinomyces sp. oral taxon 414 TaxID=712122 RepID=UPI0009F97FF3|nr:gluconokinase [Actinomyces sp. oral taxon 414]